MEIFLGNGGGAGKHRRAFWSTGSIGGSRYLPNARSPRVISRRAPGPGETGQRVTMAHKLTLRGRARTVRAASIGLALCAALSPRAAEAQQKAFYLDRLFMAGAPEDAIGMWRPQM